MTFTVETCAQHAWRRVVVTDNRVALVREREVVHGHLPIVPPDPVRAMVSGAGVVTDSPRRTSSHSQQRQVRLSALGFSHGMD